MHNKFVYFGKLSDREMPIGGSANELQLGKYIFIGFFTKY